MIKQLFVLLICFFVNHAMAIEIIEPKELQISEFEISDPDVLTKTLGTVSFQIDLSAAHDDLLALKVRRSDLKLKDGRSFTAFGVHKKAGVIIIAGGDVTHVSIASVSDKQKGRDAGVLFYGKDNKVISPKLKDIAVFDADFKPLDFNYTPMKSLGSLHMPVAIALDTSGSMDGHLGAVVSATRDFMKRLPGSARCQIFTFSNDVVRLSDNGRSYLKSCPYMIYHLNKNILIRAEAALLLQAARASEKARDRLPIFILIALYTGARSNSIFSLRWPQVDLERGYIDFTDPNDSKNKQATIIPISRKLLGHLKRHKRYGTDFGYVIHINQQRVKSVKTAFKSACIRCSIEGVTPHILRHTAASWRVQRHVPTYEVAKLLGHSSSQMIENVYGHMSPDHLMDAKER